jgi:hypothetical protein
LQSLEISPTPGVGLLENLMAIVFGRPSASGGQNRASLQAKGVCDAPPIL